MENLLALLLRKGFRVKLYKEQGLTFYSLTIKEEKVLQLLYDELYSNVYEEIDLTGVEFTVEIQTNFENPQWVFVNGLEEYKVYDEIEEFYEFVDRLPDVMEIV